MLCCDIRYLASLLAAQGAVASITLEGCGPVLVLEAAEYMPRWLDSFQDASADVSLNRIWIHAGQLHIVPVQRPATAPAQVGDLRPGKLSFDSAIAAVRSEQVSTRAPLRAQEFLARSIFTFYPEQAAKCAVRVRAWLPARTASLLVKDDYIADEAARSYQEREASNLQAAARAEHVWPRSASSTGRTAAPGELEAGEDGAAADTTGSDAADVVLCTVRMHRERAVALRADTVTLPRGWQLPEGCRSTDRATRMGMQLALGVHMYLQKWGVSQSDPAGGGGQLTLEGLQEWERYKAQLRGSGYFKDNIEGSAAYRRLLEQAEDSFRLSPLYARAIGTRQAICDCLSQAVAQPVDMQAIERSRELQEDDIECASSTARLSACSHIWFVPVGYVTWSQRAAATGASNAAVAAGSAIRRRKRGPWAKVGKATRRPRTKQRNRPHSVRGTSRTSTHSTCATCCGNSATAPVRPAAAGHLQSRARSRLSPTACSRFCKAW